MILTEEKVATEEKGEEAGRTGYLGSGVVDGSIAGDAGVVLGGC